jgi:hypothetical protein
MHDPIAVDKNWITALLCQQYYRHSQPPFVSGRSISGIWRPYRKSKRPRRESVRVGRSSASAVLLSVAPRGRPGRPCGGGGREDRLSSVLPELICYRRGHSPVPRPNRGMRSLGGRSAALHRCPTLTGRSRLWSGASLPFGRLSWRPRRACRAARPRTTPMRTRNPPRGALLAFGASGTVQFSGLWSGLRYSAESQLRYSAESQYSPTPPITADITIQPFEAAAMK